MANLGKYKEAKMRHSAKAVSPFRVPWSNCVMKKTRFALACLLMAASLMSLLLY
jgi:hypothetical protein